MKRKNRTTAMISANLVTSGYSTTGGSVASGGLLDRQVNDEREKAKAEALKKDTLPKGYDPDIIPVSLNLLTPTREAFWIPDQVQWQTFMSGQFIYNVISAARWEAR